MTNMLALQNQTSEVFYHYAQQNLIMVHSEIVDLLQTLYYDICV